MAYGIGLDIGIASVGWAAVELDYEENPWGIIKMGARIFDAAEHPKDGSSLAAPRREARSMRRRLRRHRHRLERIRQLILQAGLLTETELEHLYEGFLSDIYRLRTAALDYDMTHKEFARILLHLAQRRGFKSNRKTDKADKEAGKLLTAVNENKKRMEAKGYRTIGEMFYRDEIFLEHKRNKSEAYLATVQREMVEDEARKIFARQATHLGLSAEFLEKYLTILLSQRHFDEGPGRGPKGKESRYAGNQIERMIGTCTFEQGEKRAPKASYSFERFNLLQKINHLRLTKDGIMLPLSDEQRQKLINLAYATKDLNFAKIRKSLGIPADTTFNMVRYKTDVLTIEEAEKKEKFNYLKAYHEMRKQLEMIAPGHTDTISPEQLNEVAYAFTVYKTDEQITEYLLGKKVAIEDINALLNMGSFSKFGHLSVKACDKIVPYLEQGMTYDKACEQAGYAFKGEEKQRTNFLPATSEEMEEITSPVVRRSVAQTIKVINAIIREMGEQPTYINVELGRELAKNFAQRKELDRMNSENNARNEKLRERIKTEFHKNNPTGIDIVKLKLWEEQDGVSPYSQKRIEYARLFEVGYVDVDHIVPYSVSFDDTYKNKVLVLSHENREKGNRLPLQYLTNETTARFKVWVEGNVKNYRKKQALLKATITEEDKENFIQRNLQDTQHMSRFLFNYIRNHLLFAPSTIGRKKKVTAVKGAITAHMRKRWGISKNRANGDTHHAVDALVVACTTDKMIQEITSYSKYRETKYETGPDGTMLIDRATGLILRKFPLPWPDFRAELEARLSATPETSLRRVNLLYYQDKNLAAIKPIFVSRMPRHKVTGAAHKDTIKGIVNEDYVVVKRPLTDLKLNKEGEIEGYFAPDSDRLLYEALKAALKAHGNDGKKAFVEGFHKPKADGSQGPVVQKVKIIEKASLTVPVQQGTAVAANESMVRIDVFHREGDGYYFVPIYVADTLKEELPNKAVVAHKPYSLWKEMNETDFIFSLYPNDLIYVEHKSSIKLTHQNEESDLPKSVSTKSIFLYYVAASISSGSITVRNHDNTYGLPSLGIKSLKKIVKYQVDVLGNYHEVKKEVRQQFK